MMVPFDGSGPPQQQQSAPPLPPGPMPPGHQSAPSPVMPPQHHHQQMNPFSHPSQRRHASGGMPPTGQPFQMPPQSPAGGRQGSYGNMPGGGHQGQYSSHPPLHSPAPQPPQQQPPMHGGGMPHPQNQMRRQSQPQHPQHMGMPPMGGPSQHDSMRGHPPSNSRQQQQQPPYMNNRGGGGGGMNTNWQSDRDTPHRREMIQHIVKLLKKDKNGSPESLQKLPQMAKQLEVSLYRQAPSFNAYMDMATLKHRLQEIAVEVSRKARNQGGDNNREDSHWPGRQQPSNNYNNGTRPPDPGGNRGSPSFMGSNQPSSSMPPQIGGGGGGGAGNRNNMGGLDNFGSMTGGSINGGIGIGGVGNSGGGRSGGGGMSNGPSISSRSSSSNPINDTSGVIPQNRNDPEWKIRIRHKQQRLLLLHHSAKCPHEDGRCTVTPHCADMKRLWRHIENCKDNNCRVPHCFSSRVILSHYRKCKDPTCPACGPVRDTVRKSTSRNPMRPNPSSAPPISNNNMMAGGIGGSMSVGMPGPMAGGMSERISSNPMPPRQHPQHSQQAQMMSNDRLSVSPPGNLFPSNNPSVNNSYQQQRPQQSMHSSMPPPMSGPGSGSSSGNQYSSNSHYQSRAPASNASGGGGGSSDSVQNMFRPDQPSASGSHGSHGSMPRIDTKESSSSMHGGASTGSGGRSKGNDSEWQKVRHKQQRLLLLRHASRCQYEAGKCPVTPHCASMKELWRHIAHCKDQQCSVQHCMSSRYVLSHYRRCKDVKCPACGPVRDTIRKSHEKEKLKQGGGNSSSFTASFDQMDTMSRQSRHSDDGSNPNRVDNNNLMMKPVPSAAPSPPEPSYQPEPKRAKTMASVQQVNESVVPAPSAPVVSIPPPAPAPSPPPVMPPAPMPIEPPAGTSPAPQPAAISAPPPEPLEPPSPATAPPATTVSSAAPSLPMATVDPAPPPEATPSAEPIAEVSAPRQVESSTDSESVQSPAAVSSTEKPKVTPPVTISGTTVKPATKTTGDLSLLNSFSLKDLEVHLAALNRKTQLPPAKLKSKCLEVLKGLQGHPHGWVFNIPVDPDDLGLPDYFEVIKKPMDLGTIHKRLDSGGYHAIEDFKNDVNLTFDNAMTYNEDGSVVYDMAKELKIKFEADFKKLMAQLEAEDKERRQNERACTLCGCEKLLFEPPVFFCNGTNCQSARIRRNSHFYVGGNNQYFWCNQCYNDLDDKASIDLGDLTVTKSDLKKKKNDEVHEESWVECDCCKRWVHQICGLFNTRQNKEHNSKYFCPSCLYEKRKANDPSAPVKGGSPLGATDLTRTTLSEWLEQHIAKKVQEKKVELAEKKAQAENIPIEEATKSIEVGGPVIIRQVTAMDRKLEVREKMKKRYADKNYPDEFPFRCKCLLVFQHLDGVDVVLFALYVYEHGEDNPPPNQRCVYISYLDSVHFMRPRMLRTFVYHEILIAYLDYARRKGFATAHIWACPPLKGDDYIFYAKPEDQKTPRDSRLRQWYIDMLEICQRRSIVGKLTNMYDLYFANEKLDATAVPYLEGDYFPGEAENIIKTLEEGGGKKGSSNGKKSKKKGTSKSRGGTRSTGVDETALIESGILDGTKNPDRDQVMVKMAGTIEPMKESFIVAFLCWSGAKEEDMIVPEAIVQYRKEHPEQCEASTQSGTKRDVNGNIRDILAPVYDRHGEPVKVIDDDKEDLDCEFFNNRQAFLNLCRGNHYQFDELRRAKHTSMMVLWHLHNRDAPKFVQQCVACNREILSGKRYHCATCPDYDLCEECYKDPKCNRGNCSHKLQPIAVEQASQDEQSGGSNLTEEERLQRQRNLMLHIQLLEHASGCKSSSCKSSNCVKMKGYLAHARSCKVKAQGGCKICKKIWTLLRIHAQRCKDTVCPIPQCMAIREKMRQLKNQQQAMDDRRRAEMNRQYRMNIAAGNG